MPVACDVLGHVAHSPLFANRELQRSRPKKVCCRRETLKRNIRLDSAVSAFFGVSVSRFSGSAAKYGPTLAAPVQASVLPPVQTTVVAGQASQADNVVPFVVAKPSGSLSSLPKPSPSASLLALLFVLLGLLVTPVWMAAIGWLVWQLS